MNANKGLIALKAAKYLTVELIPFYLKNSFQGRTSVVDVKNKYENERCFIVGTGPSLTIEDLEMLKNEYTFSMNSVVRLFGKTDWRPSFYVLQDRFAHQELKPLSQYFSNTIIFITEDISRTEENLANKYNFRLRPYKDSWLLLKHKIGFSSDPGKYVIDGRTITYSIMQLAHYMGFSQIYLIGVDWNYQKGKDNHMKGLSLSHDSADFIENSHDIQMTAMHIAYTSAEKYSREHGFRIYNAGRGGNLDVFERVILEDVIS